MGSDPQEAGNDPQDWGTDLVTEQLPEPCEHRREKHVSTEGPHKKDGPGALPADAETRHRQVRALDTASTTGLGL